MALIAFSGPEFHGFSYSSDLSRAVFWGLGLGINTGCPTKNYTLFWRAVASLNFEIGIKVWGVLESSGSQLFKTVPTFDF